MTQTPSFQITSFINFITLFTGHPLDFPAFLSPITQCYHPPFRHRRPWPRFSQLQPPAARSPARSPWSSPGPGNDATTSSDLKDWFWFWFMAFKYFKRRSSKERNGSWGMDLNNVVAYINIWLVTLCYLVIMGYLWVMMLVFLRDGSLLLAFVHGSWLTMVLPKHS